MAPGRVKLLRQASAIVRLGAGSANGRTLSMSCPGKKPVTEVFGTTVIPIPDATISRMVSSELPSSVC